MWNALEGRLLGESSIVVQEVAHSRASGDRQEHMIRRSSGGQAVQEQV